MRRLWLCPPILGHGPPIVLSRCLARILLMSHVARAGTRDGTNFRMAHQLNSYTLHPESENSTHGKNS